MTKDADPAAYLSMDENDAVEVYAAIEIAVKVYQATGDHVMEGHFTKLLNRLKASDGAPMSVDKFLAGLDDV